MIDTGLNKKYTPQEQKEFNYDPIPEGIYPVRVTSIDKWNAVTKKNVKVFNKTPDGKFIMDEKNKKTFQMHKEIKYYTADMKLEVAGGEHQGRILFTNLTTHPNADYIIPAFLYAVEAKELSAAEIQDNCVGSYLAVKVIINEYTKKVQDPDTGVEKEIPKVNNKVTVFYNKSKSPIEFVEEQPLEITDDDLPF